MTGQWPEPVADRGGPRVLSIGTAGGITSGFDGLPDGGGLVRLGDDLLSIDKEEYRLWDAGLLAPMRDALLRQARETGLREPEALLRELAEAHLVVEYAHEPAAIGLHASDHTARFTGRFTGNGPHRSARFLVGVGAAAPFLSVDVVLYEFLLWADGRASIAEQCARLATGGLPRGFSPVQHVVESLPVLLRAGVISLDRVSGAERPTMS
jgi:hypothetical protein